MGNDLDLNSLIVPALLFFVVAILYSSAGFGGGSSYLAILLLFNFSYTIIPILGLTCNLVVVSQGCYLRWKEGDFNFKKVFPFLIGSIPFSFLGGSIHLSERIFFFLLGSSLVIASLHVFQITELDTSKFDSEKAKINSKKLIGIGGLLGFISGMTGIGGGIFLSPVLYMIRFSTPKKIAAISSFFILINSMSGLGAQWLKVGQKFEYPLFPALILGVVVFMGSFLGIRFSIRVFSYRQLRLASAGLTFIAGIRILLK